MPSLFQKALLCVALSGFVCANVLLRKKKAHSLSEAVLRLKQPKRERGKCPKMAEAVHGVSHLQGMSTEPTAGGEGFAWGSEPGWEGMWSSTNPPTHLHCSWKVGGGFLIFSEGVEGISHCWHELTTLCMCRAGACAGGAGGTAASMKCSRATAGRRALAWW